MHIKAFEEKGKPEILKKASKAGHRFTDILDLQNNEKRASFQAGNRQLNKQFPGKSLKSPVTYELGINAPCKLVKLKEEFNFPCKSKSSRMAVRRAKVSLSLETRIF